MEPTWATRIWNRVGGAFLATAGQGELRIEDVRRRRIGGGPANRPESEAGHGQRNQHHSPRKHRLHNPPGFLSFPLQTARGTLGEIRGIVKVRVWSFRATECGGFLSAYVAVTQSACRLRPPTGWPQVASILNFRRCLFFCDVKRCGRCNRVVSCPAGRVRAEETARSEEDTSELQSRRHVVCRLLLDAKDGVVGPVHA